MKRRGRERAFAANLNTTLHQVDRPPRRATLRLKQRSCSSDAEYFGGWVYHRPAERPIHRTTCALFTLQCGFTLVVGAFTADLSVLAIKLSSVGPSPFPPCGMPSTPVTVPAPMGSSFGKRFLFFASAIALVCSCEKHRVGEYPEVQREKGAENAQAPAAEAAPASSPSPSVKPTPVEFFPTKPR
jgi:hypothetical protein